MPVVECGSAGTALAPPLTPQSALIGLGPTILVDIGFDPAVLTQVAAGAPVQVPVAAGNPIVRQVWALIDTGALDSCVDDTIAQQLQLPIVNQQQIAGVGGAHTLNVYLAYIAVPLLGTIRAGMFVGAQLIAGGQPHGALLGRTFLADTLLVYDGLSGSVKLAR